MPKLAFSFKAKTPEGQFRLIHVYVETSESGARENLDELPMSRKRFRTSGGQPVVRIARGKYRIVPTGEVLASSDPEAP